MRNPLTLILSLALTLTLTLSPSGRGQTVEQRLAALEQDVKAIKLVVPLPESTPVELPPANAMAITEVTPLSRWHAVHLKIDEATAQTLPVVQWVSDTGVERRGFNAAFVAEDGNVVVCTINGKATAAYHITWPAAPAATAVPPGSDICTLKPGVYTLATGEYVAGSEKSFQDITLVGAGVDKTVVRYKGPAKLGWRWATGDRCVMRGLTMVSNYVYDHTLPTGFNPATNKNFQPARAESTGFMQAGSDSAFIDVKVIGFNDAFNTNAHPTNRVLWLRCIGDNPIGCFIWNEATQACTYDCTANNSRIEHIARGANYAWWALNGNTFANVDHRFDADPATRDVNDDAKGTIVMQYGSYVYCWDNALTGPFGFGPLQVAAGPTSTLDQFLRYGVVERQRSLTSGVELQTGLDTFRVSDCPIKLFWNLDARKIKNGIVPKGTQIPSVGVENVKAAA